MLISLLAHVQRFIWNAETLSPHQFFARRLFLDLIDLHKNTHFRLVLILHLTGQRRYLVGKTYDTAVVVVDLYIFLFIAARQFFDLARAAALLYLGSKNSFSLPDWQ